MTASTCSPTVLCCNRLAAWRSLRLTAQAAMKLLVSTAQRCHRTTALARPLVCQVHHQASVSLVCSAQLWWTPRPSPHAAPPTKCLPWSWGRSKPRRHRARAVTADGRMSLLCLTSAPRRVRTTPSGACATRVRACVARARVCVCVCGGVYVSCCCILKAAVLVSQKSHANPASSAACQYQTLQQVHALTDRSLECPHGCPLHTRTHACTHIHTPRRYCDAEPRGARPG